MVIYDGHSVNHFDFSLLLNSSSCDLGTTCDLVTTLLNEFHWKWIRKDKQKRKILWTTTVCVRSECFLKHVSVVHNIACRKIWDKYPASNNIFFFLLLLLFISCGFLPFVSFTKYVPDCGFIWWMRSEKKMKHMQNICFQCQKLFTHQETRPYAFSRLLCKDIKKKSKSLFSVGQLAQVQQCFEL